MMLTEKGPNYVYSGNDGLQVFYLAMWSVNILSVFLPSVPALS